jgi:hypothetical protein
MSRVWLDLVWLRFGRGVRAEQTRRSAQRPLMLRLSIASSIAIQWASRIRAVVDRVTAVRKPDAYTTVMVQSLALRRAATARLLHDGLVESVWNRSNDSSRSLGHATAPPVTLSPSRRVNVRWSDALTSRRGPFDAPLTLTLPRTRTHADAHRFASVPMASRRTRRIEPHVLAPPPMVGRTTSRTVMSSADQPRQNVHDFPSPLGFAMNERGGWMPTPGALASALSPGLLDSVTDHVVREIDSRVRAKRERLGKV